MVQNQYYRHSGQFVLTSVILGTLAATALGSVLAAVYAALVLYIPFAGVITFVLSIGFGVLLGLAIAATLRWAKVRHEGIAFLSSAVAASSSYYVSWAVWTWLLLLQSEVEAHLTALALQPGVLWEVLGEINTVGAWSMSGFTPTGAVLWVLWGAESLLVLVPAVLVPLGVLERLERLGHPGAHDASWIRVDLHDCPSCQNLHTMTLKSITFNMDDDGHHQQKELEVVNHFLLSTDEAHRIKALQPAD